MTDKPPLPTRMFDPWPPIAINTDQGAGFHHIQRIAGSAATKWALGPDGTYAQGLTLAATVDGAVREALLHLMELGFIDIDSERLNNAPGWPMSRTHPGAAGDDA